MLKSIRRPLWPYSSFEIIRWLINIGATCFNEFYKSRYKKTIYMNILVCEVCVVYSVGVVTPPSLSNVTLSRY